MLNGVIFVVFIGVYLFIAFGQSKVSAGVDILVLVNSVQYFIKDGSNFVVYCVIEITGIRFYRIFYIFRKFNFQNKNKLKNRVNKNIFNYQ